MPNRSRIAEKESWLFFNMLRGILSTDDPMKTILVAYLLYLSNHQEEKELSYRGLVSGELTHDLYISNCVREYLREEEWDLIKDKCGSFSDECLKQVIMTPFASKGGPEETPESISALAVQALDLKKDDYVADLGCGTGGFLRQIPDDLHINIDCVDINTRLIDILRIRRSVLGIYPNIIQTNVFSLASDPFKYNKIFFNYPFVVNLKEDPIVEEFLDMVSNHPKVKARSSDWVYNTLVMQLLAEGGKAAVIMTGGSLFNTPDKDWRQWFVENGWIEAIIALPANMLAYTSIPTYMLILSRENHSIRFLDATKAADIGRRQSYFSEKAIDLIVESLFGENQLGKTIDVNTIRENDFYLSPNAYLSEQIAFKDEIVFGEIIKKSSRGAMISAKELDSLVTDEDTGVKYLQLKDIQNGMIGERLANIKAEKLEMKKHCAENGNLIIPKIYSDGKVSVIEKKEDESIVVSANLFILELDETKANPFYIKAFLESEVGRNQLRGLASGTTIPTISLSALNKMPIPLPPMEKQAEIANMYLAIQDEIKVLQTKLQAAEERLSLTFEKGGDWFA